MKFILIVAALVAVAAAAPAALEQPRPTPVPILQFDEERDAYGQFSLSYTTGDGTTITRQGALKITADGKDFVLVQSGSESYTSPSGVKIVLTWVADEDGYRPIGDHLPVTPIAPAAPAPLSPAALA